MGTVYIEEYGSLGSVANRDAPISDLNTLLVTTKDATTSGTAGNVVLGDGSRVVTIYAVEAHRICIGSDTTATTYAIIPAGQVRSFGVNAGETLYYELDA